MWSWYHSISFLLRFIAFHKLIFALFLCHHTITRPHHFFFSKKKRYNKLFLTNVNLKAASSSLEHQKLRLQFIRHDSLIFHEKKKSRGHVLITPCYLAVCKRLQASDKWSGRAFLSYSWHSVIIRGGENTPLNQCVFLTFVNLSGHSERRHNMHNVTSANLRERNLHQTEQTEAVSFVLNSILRKTSKSLFYIKMLVGGGGPSKSDKKFGIHITSLGKTHWFIVFEKMIGEPQAEITSNWLHLMPHLFIFQHDYHWTEHSFADYLFPPSPILAQSEWTQWQDTNSVTFNQERTLFRFMN